MGKPREQLLGGNPYDTFSPDLAAEQKQRIEKVISSGEPLISLDQRTGRWLEVNHYPIFDRSGKVDRVAVFARDVTERIRAEKELKRSEARYRELTENAPNAHLSIDPLSGLILTHNRALVSLLGYSSGELLTMTVHDLFAEGPAGREKTVEIFSQDMAKNPVSGEDLRAKRKDRSTEWVSLSITNLYDESGNIVELRSVLYDISEHRRAAEELRQAKEAAESASRAKSEFLGNMSHELRSPLNAIIGFTEAMQLEIFGPLGNERYVEYLKDIHQSGSHLHDLINDLLDVSAIEAGQLAIHEERLDLFALGEEVIQMMAPRARDGGVALSNRIARNFPHLRADERRMKQVLVNLLSNAVKFTPENGKITVDAGRGGDGALLIWVTDNGIGMDEQGIVTALTPFGQIDSVLTRQHEGTGLGLPLTKGLVEAHGGTLEIESDLGGGTKVLIRFPQDRKVL